jgi:hypothetical protein
MIQHFSQHKGLKGRGEGVLCAGAGRGSVHHRRSHGRAPGNRDTCGNEQYFNVLAARIPGGHPAPDIG